MKTLRARCWLVAALLWPAVAGAVTDAGGALSLAVVPQFPALEIHRVWTPVAKALEQSLGRPVMLKMYASIPVFERDFLAGQPDLVYLNPYHMVMAHRAHGYLPLVRDGAQQLSGILMVQAGSPITALADLNGRQIAFPAPNAFGASLLLRALLADEHHVRFTPVYVKMHGNAYRYTARGETAAAGGIRSTLQREPEELRSKLRLLYESPGFAAHPLAVHPRLPREVREKVASVLPQMKQGEEGRATLAAIPMKEPVPADYNRDYARLEKLGLERLVVLED